MAEYTQGKWEVKGLKIECFGQGIIALCPTPQEGGTFNCSANARLIAKAPATYEALKKLAVHCEQTEKVKGELLDNAFAVLSSIEGGK